MILLGNKIASNFPASVGRAHGIILSEWRCIIWLASNPGTSGQDTAQGTAMDRMSVSRNLRSLEKKKLALREQGSMDAKKWQWHLTPAGRAVYDAIMPEAVKRDRQITGAFSADELAAFQSAITSAINALDK